MPSIGQAKRILILGSAPDAVSARAWKSQPFDCIVAINNAWQIRPDWDDLIFPAHLSRLIFSPIKDG